MHGKTSNPTKWIQKNLRGQNQGISNRLKEITSDSPKVNENPTFAHPQFFPAQPG
jgi:hypothetical protein